MKLSKIFLCFIASLLIAVSGCSPEKEAIKPVIETLKPTILPTAQPTEVPTIRTETKVAETPMPKETETPAQSPTDSVESVTQLLCELDVNCRQAIENIELLPEGKRVVIPKDGVILSGQNIEFQEGESVFDVLKRELNKSKIHFEFVKTPMYNSAYIEGISNLYEFDMGEYSGWMYRVNGEKPNVGSSQYKLVSGDKIEVYYAVNYLNEKK